MRVTHFIAVIYQRRVREYTTYKGSTGHSVLAVSPARPQTTDMPVAVVTGSNKGIGLAIVRSLCQKYEGDVYLTSRDEGRGLAALETLRREGLEPKYHQLDICQEESVIKLRDFITEKYGGIDILVNNVGIAFMDYDTYGFATQVKMTLETNYWATKTASNILFPVLKPGARVVNMSSALGFLGKLVEVNIVPNLHNT